MTPRPGSQRDVAAVYCQKPCTRPQQDKVQVSTAIYITPTPHVNETMNTVDEGNLSGGLVKRGSRAATRVVARSPTAAAVVRAVSRGGVAALSSATALCWGREALDNAIAGQHASVDGEVSADHKGTHGGIFLG